MAAKIIAVTNQKGGVGKTTVTMQLAGISAERGYETLVIDADPQGTATRWASSAPDDRQFSAQVVQLSAAGGKVHREAKRFVDRYDLIVIDCPPAVDSPIPQSALLCADLAVVPIVASPPDLWAAVGIRRLIEDVGDLNESLIARLVINDLEPNTLISKDVVDILEDFHIPVAKTMLHHRTAYRRSSADGCTVHGLSPIDIKANIETASLVDELHGLLGFEQRIEKGA